MGHNSYVELVKQYFSFLNRDFGFSGPYQLSDDSDSISIGTPIVVEYRSQVTIVTIERDRYGALGVMLRPIAETRGLSLGWILEFFTGETKALDIKPYIPAERINSVEAARGFLKFMKAYYSDKDTTPFKVQLSPDETRRREAWQEYRLGVYASALRKFGSPFLRGDFSEWTDLNEYVKQESARNYQSMINRGKHNKWRAFYEHLKQKWLDIYHARKKC